MWPDLTMRRPDGKTQDNRKHKGSMSTKTKPTGTIVHSFIVDLTREQVIEIARTWGRYKDDERAMLCQPHWDNETGTGHLRIAVMDGRLSKTVHNALKGAKQPKKE
jgi:hypothetical protein